MSVSNPYESPRTDDTSRGSPVESVIDSRPRALRFCVCAFGWTIGTFLLSISFGIDLFLSSRVPGYFLDATIISSLLITFVCSFAAPLRIGNRVLAFFAAVTLMIVQFFFLAILSIALTGLDGVQ